jgi:large subunit ribosomal protein L25
MSEAIFNLDASIRNDLGKGASRRLRHSGKVPAILYGGDEAPISLTLEHNKLVQAQDFEAFYSHVLTLNIEGKKVEALVKDMQRHPFKPKVTHVDFQRVIAGEKLTTNVPLHFVNENKAPGIKTDGGHAEHQVLEIEVTCLPKDLPEFIEVDMGAVELGETVHLTDIKLPKGVESVELSKGEGHDLAIVTIKAPKGPSAADAADEAGEEASEE